MPIAISHNGKPYEVEAKTLGFEFDGNTAVTVVDALNTSAFDRPNVRREVSVKGSKIAAAFGRLDNPPITVQQLNTLLQQLAEQIAFGEFDGSMDAPATP